MYDKPMLSLDQTQKAMNAMLAKPYRVRIPRTTPNASAAKAARWPRWWTPCWPRCKAESWCCIRATAPLWEA